MTAIEADFGGWATKAGIQCTDGRTIMTGAFKHEDQKRIPLVYQHLHSSIDNVLGHAVLEHREEGVYAYGFFNETPQGENAREMVKHGDINSLSIHANRLVERNKNVHYGNINELSLVLAGANPGAKIDYVNIKHSDGSFTELEDDVIITMGLELEHSLDSIEETVSDETGSGTAGETVETPVADDTTVEHADKADKSVEDVFDAMDDDEKNVVAYLINAAVETAGASMQQSDNSAEGGEITHQEGADDMSGRNVFDTTTENKENGKPTLSHSDVAAIFEDAKKRGSLKEAVHHFLDTNTDTLAHGIDNIDVLFPDAKMATGVIELEKRRTEWVSTVLNGTRHTPFARIKTFTADLTQEEARAKGYIKGNYKEEEWIGVTKRTTSPTTIYKKQKLDRDDMIDITDFDIVAFLKGEMRLMTEEEIARAILIGDGRSPSAEDKIKDPLGASDGVGIRSILNDHELFVTTAYVNVLAVDADYEDVVDVVMDAMEFYKGTGTPTFFTTIPELNKFKKARDEMGRRFYQNNQEVADALGVSSIVTVEPMKEHSDLIGIIVNLDDYNVGTDKGGELTMFEDFDIDYNQQKYLLETRMSGALVRPKSAIILMKTDSADDQLVTPVKPDFDKVTGVITIPTVTGMVYKNGAGTTLTAGAQTALAAGASATITAVASAGYYFETNQEDSWTFKRNPA